MLNNENEMDVGTAAVAQKEGRWVKTSKAPPFCVGKESQIGTSILKKCNYRCIPDSTSILDRFHHTGKQRMEKVLET